MLTVLSIKKVISGLFVATLFASEHSEEIEDYPYPSYLSQTHSIEIDEDDIRENLKLEETLMSHLNSKVYFEPIRAKITKIVETCDEADEVNDGLLKIFRAHMNDYNQIIEKKDLAIGAFFTTALNEFSNKAGLVNLVKLYQELYINYQYEGLASHYINRTTVRSYLTYFNVCESRSASAMVALEQISENMGFKICPAIYGAKSASLICLNNLDAITMLSADMLKFSSKEKKQFLIGAYNFYLSQYYYRNFTVFLEYCNFRKSKKRQDIESLKGLANLLRLELPVESSGGEEKLVEKRVGELLESYLDYIESWQNWLLGRYSAPAAASILVPPKIDNDQLVS